MGTKRRVCWLGIVLIALISVGELLAARMAARTSGWDSLGVAAPRSKRVP